MSTVTYYHLPRRPVDPQKVLNVFQLNVSRTENPDLQRTLDKIAADFAAKNNLEYDRQTEDPSLIKSFRKLIGK